MDLYHQCVVGLEKDGYKYPAKVNRDKQANFEPLEIYYKIHSYALKKTRRLVREGSKSLSQVKEELLTIEAHLRRFSHCGVVKGSSVCAKLQ